MHIGLAADHGGFSLKQGILKALLEAGHTVEDFGAEKLDPSDDYPDFVIPLAKAVSSGGVERGIAVCGSGVGACIAANKIPGVRAALINETFSAHQGVEDDEMNIICLGGRVIGSSLAWEITNTFIAAQPQQAERFKRRLEKVRALEHDENQG